MAPAKQQQYRFSPQSIVELRKKLGISQTALARSIGVPPNTLSRWEIGATTPDAKSLAAIHSIAMENGITPNFFRKIKKQTMKRTRLLVVWDFPDFAAHFQHVPNVDAWIREECGKRFTTTTQRTYKAFVRATRWPSPFDPSDALLDRGWKVWEEEEGEELSDSIIEHCRSDCGQDPLGTTLVLIARDGDYADMINELKGRGVRTYLLGFGCSQELIDAVGVKRLIELPWPSNFVRISPKPSNHPWIEHRLVGWH